MLEWVILCGYVIGITPSIYIYKGNLLRGKDYFPFHEYNNVLVADDIRNVYNMETSMIKGLENALRWFLEHRDEI